MAAWPLHTGGTLTEILLGLSLGVGLATVIGYAVAKSRALERMLSPYLVASQAIPLVAIAPLLVIWFGPGMFSKILICAMIVFFPVLVNTVVGVRAVPPALHDLMHSLHASSAQILLKLEVPAALPVFLGGLRIGATLVRDRRSGRRTGRLGPRAGIPDQRRPRPVRHGPRFRRGVHADRRWRCACMGSWPGWRAARSDGRTGERNRGASR